MFYEKLLCAQILKSKKDTDKTVFFVLLGSASIKSAGKIMVKSTNPKSQSYKQTWSFQILNLFEIP